MADKNLNVLTICGSLRKGSYNAALIRALPALAPAHVKLTAAPPYDGLPLYNTDIQTASGFPPAAEDLATAIRGADGVLIVSPEYNWTIPGGLKNAIDWVSRMKDQPFKDKPVAIQSASMGALGGARMQYHMRMTLTYLSAHIFGTPEILVAAAHTKFDEKTLELKDEPTKTIVKQQLEAFAKYIERVSAK
ncbi:MAG TPA: NADPH-dependent FMN reductase [Pseudolabrys sp.]|nr:NADPH-dependent FMN reductase [Pseudolabrys sp.]